MRKIIVLSAAIFVFAQAAFSADITVKELHDRLAAGEEIFLVNVSDEGSREAEKFDLGGKLIDPYAFLDGDAGLADRKHDEIVIYDRTGRQSGQTVLLLIQRGFTNVRSLIGGLLRWIEAYGRTMPTPNPKAAAQKAAPRSAPTLATPSDSISGKFEGAIKSDQTGDIPITVELETHNGKVSGKIESRQGSFAITGGTFTDGRIIMKFDAGGGVGTIDATINGDKITGRWQIEDKGGLLEIKRLGAAPAVAPTLPGKDPITGEWIAVVDLQGQNMPFALRLKLEGSNVTGSSASQLAEATIKGTWNGDKLTFTIEAANGMINMNAVLKDGKLVGEYDYAGQLSGKWEATKK